MPAYKHRQTDRYFGTWAAASHNNGSIMVSWVLGTGNAVICSAEDEIQCNFIALEDILSPGLHFALH